MLAFAYERCRANGGAPGVDGQTFGMIESQGREARLGELAEKLRTRDRAVSVLGFRVRRASVLENGSAVSFAESVQEQSAGDLREDRHCDEQPNDVARR
ncbi:MAG: hypothetical protein K2X38_06140, partial [Gemmataceae bacterium]|nr:hypothetical protein [Gemmataceae bacterium]